jgi:hypothetical protein
MRMHTKSGRSRWPYVIGSALVVVVVAGGLVYTANQPAPEPTQSAEPTPTTTVPADGGSSGAGDGDEGAAPTGCLGGQERNAAMVLAAQTAAPHTTFGAVEVATSFYRSLWQYPAPSAEESNAVAAGLIASTATPAWKDVATQYQSEAWAQLVSKNQAYGSSFYTSTANGIWRVTEDSTTDRVTVEMAVGYVFDDVLSPTEVAGLALVMVWENNGWHVESGVPVDQDKLAAGGTRFTEGC